MARWRGGDHVRQWHPVRQAEESRLTLRHVRDRRHSQPPQRLSCKPLRHMPWAVTREGRAELTNGSGNTGSAPSTSRAPRPTRAPHESRESCCELLARGVRALTHGGGSHVGVGRRASSARVFIESTFGVSGTHSPTRRIQDCVESIHNGGPPRVHGGLSRGVEGGGSRGVPRTPPPGPASTRCAARRWGRRQCELVGATFSQHMAVNDTRPGAQ